MKQFILMVMTTVFVASFSYAQSCAAKATCNKTTTTSSLQINSVMPDSPAERAGLLADDIITTVNDQAISTETELTALLAEKQAGDYIKLQYSRDGETFVKNIRLEAPERSVGLLSIFAGEAQPAYLGVSLRASGNSSCSKIDSCAGTNAAKVSNSNGKCVSTCTRKTNPEQ